MIVAGIMSGTSVDAIDVALVEITGEGESMSLNLLGFHEVGVPDEVRREILGVSDAIVAVSRVSQLNFLLGRLYGYAVLEACNAAGLDASELDLVGSHGQTIFHQASPANLCGFDLSSTMQIGEPACIARVVGTAVVADFRPADIAAGGLGAPLVPFADYLLYRHPEVNRVALNIGGIANLTSIPAGQGPGAVKAFDTGPGNMVVDELVACLTSGTERFDRDGSMACRGTADESLLSSLLLDPYFGQSPPKTTGRERFGTGFASRLLATGLDSASMVATATELTARSIVLAIRRFVRPSMPVDELVISGGGWRNPAIVGSIRDGLPGTRVRASDEFGIGTDAKEAVAFAVLAYETWHGRPSNLPSATGARYPAILGKVVPRPR